MVKSEGGTRVLVAMHARSGGPSGGDQSCEAGATGGCRVFVSAGVGFLFKRVIPRKHDVLVNRERSASFIDGDGVAYEVV